MKNRVAQLFRISAIFLMLLIIITACKEENTDDPVQLPELSTLAVQEITSQGAVSGGEISDEGDSPITVRGLVWSTSENPTTGSNEGITSEGNGIGTFPSTLTNLIPYTTYYVRAYAANSGGTAYGNQLEFETLPEGAFGTVADIDGNVYWTVAFGDKEWMVQNLRTTKYSDGTSIPSGLSEEEWANTIEGAYAVYPYEDTLGDSREFEPVLEYDDYGFLYNAYAALHGNICPEGWYVPSNDEWQSSLDFVAAYYNLNNYEVGDAFKSCRQVNSPMGGGCKTIWHPRWDESDQAHGTNRAFFLALPAGYLDPVTGYSGIGKDLYWWTSTQNVSSTQSIGLRHDYSGYSGGASNNNRGHSIRCYRPIIKE